MGTFGNFIICIAKIIIFWFSFFYGDKKIGNGNAIPRKEKF
jgi:hypothetical protein